MIGVNLSSSTRKSPLPSTCRPTPTLLLLSPPPTTAQRCPRPLSGRPGHPRRRRGDGSAGRLIPRLAQAQRPVPSSVSSTTHRQRPRLRPHRSLRATRPTSLRQLRLLRTATRPLRTARRSLRLARSGTCPLRTSAPAAATSIPHTRPCRGTTRICSRSSNCRLRVPRTGRMEALRPPHLPLPPRALPLVPPLRLLSRHLPPRCLGPRNRHMRLRLPRQPMYPRTRLPSFRPSATLPLPK